MSFLILAFRKLSLKQRINRGNFRLMNIQFKQNAIQDKLRHFEQIKSTISNSWDTIKSSLSSVSNSIFQAQVDAANSHAESYKEAYVKATKSGNNDLIEQAKAAMERAAAEAENKSKSIWQQQYAQAMGQAALSQAATSLFDNANQAQMKALQKQDNEYDLERESLQTQLTAWNAEYSNLDKSVESAAQAAAPKYVA